MRLPARIRPAYLFHQPLEPDRVSGFPPSTADLETARRTVLWFRRATGDICGQASFRFACSLSTTAGAHGAYDSHGGRSTSLRGGCRGADVHQDATHFSRKILLRRQSDRRVVHSVSFAGALDTLDQAARQEIISQRTPLGRVLIEHGIMRAVQMLGLWQVSCGPDLAQYFDVEPGHLTYGRTALIYCNSEPAVELLEIVAPEDLFTGN